jgi:hypothetical protein
MYRLLFAPLFAAIATFAVAAPMSKEQLSTPPAGARHYTISSTAGKHGDVWSWTLPDGSRGLSHVDVPAGLGDRGRRTCDRGQRWPAYGHRDPRLYRSG